MSVRPRTPPEALWLPRTANPSSETSDTQLLPTMDTRAFIAGLPKAELHVHLEGCLEPTLIRKIALRNHVSIPPGLPESAAQWHFHDLDSFLDVYFPNTAVLLREQDFFDVIWDYLVKAHAERVVHVEMFFDPQAHTSRGVPFGTVIRGYKQAIIKAEKELGMSVALIMCFLRDLDPRWAMDTLAQALPYKDYIVGVGLDSDSADNPPRKFREVFQRAREEGFLLTMHCDVVAEDSVEHIRQAVQEIQVDRLDHASTLIQDESLIELVKQKGLGLTCCPVSNHVIAGDYEAKEIKSLLDRGVRCTINSDDPGYFNAYMNANLETLVAAGVGLSDIVKLVRNGFLVSWISTQKKDQFLELLDDYVRKSGVL